MPSLPALAPQLLLSIIALFPAIWLYTAYMSRAQFPSLHAARILLLIAHPDDEAMFFAPTVQALCRPGQGNHVKILCLSTGDADGLGETRKREIRDSAKRLGVRDEADVFVLDDKNLQDGKPWAASDITPHLLRAFARDAHKTPATQPPRADIDVLITFDRRGVSGHHNHISCRSAALAWHAKLMERHDGWESPVAVYTLASVNILRKYAGALDTVVSVVWAMLRLILTKDKYKKGWAGLPKGGAHGAEERKRGKESAEKNVAAEMPSWLLFVSGFSEWTNALGAMVYAHKSQMVWFRWGWISIGRYMMINELRRIR